MTIGGAQLGTRANQDACTVGSPVASIGADQSQIFFRFQAHRVRAGDILRVDWMDPRGTVSSSASWDSLPSASDLCFLTALPIGGFPPGSQPGEWTVRVSGNGAVLLTRGFRITGPPPATGLVVTGVHRIEAEGQTELRIEGAGFGSDSVANIAQYGESGGWQYIAVLLPASVAPNWLTVRLPVLAPAEYLVIVRNPDGSQSPPARFLVSIPGSYKLPFTGGGAAQITQGPYGSFSHWGNSLHAFDITAPRGTCIVAMRGGIAHPKDLGFRQTQNRRIFGNYVTIAHDDGSFSHYAHLATGTFQVKEGQRVEQGHPLAVMGNSGYTLGEGGGYHVHVHVTKGQPISSQSVPFRFDELPLTPQRTFRGTLVSANRDLPDPCAGTPSGDQTAASVAVAEWWLKAVPIPGRARRLEVRLEWEGEGRELHLNLTSPSGRQYGAYGDPTGYSGAGKRPESVALNDPEPGMWRIGVHGAAGNGEAITFRLSTSVVPGKRVN